MNAVDTNVLIYAHDPREPAKQTTAMALLSDIGPAALPWQVICEYLWASRKLEPLGYSRAQAWDDLRDMAKLWTVLYPKWRIVDRVQSLMSQFSLSYWDALLVAACLEDGVTRLYSEDIT